MISRFEPFLTLEARHAYSGGPSARCEFVLPAETRALLRAGRIVARSAHGVLRLVYEADDQGSPRVPLSGSMLRVGIRLAHRGLAAQTDLGFDPGDALLLRNQADPGRLDAVAPHKLCGPLVHHATRVTSRPLRAALLEPGGAVVADVALEGSETELTFDTKGRRGVLEVEETADDDASQRFAYYADPELRQEGVVAIAEIAISPSLYEIPATLVVSFAVRSDPLRYLVVAKGFTSSQLDDILVRDTGFSAENRAEIAFGRLASDAIEALALPVSAFGGTDTSLIVFQSNAPVERRSLPRRGIQLARGSQVVLAHLPQPSADRAGADFVIHISKT